MLQQARCCRNTVISGLTHKQEHINAIGSDIIVFHEFPCCLKAQVTGHHIGGGDAALLNTNVIDCLFYFFLRNQVAQVLVVNHISGDAGTYSLDSYSIKRNFGHKSNWMEML